MAMMSRAHLQGLLLFGWRLVCVVAWHVSVPNVNIAPGVAMPMLALGSARPGFTNCTVQEAVEMWLRLGGRHIDTASEYGTQTDVGLALKASGVPRREVFITTKVSGPIGKQATIDVIRNKALAELGVDYIDLVLIHWPCSDDADFPDKCGTKDREIRLETWAGLMQLKDEGAIRAAGVSNFNGEHVADIVAAGGKPAVNQVEWHLGYHNETLLAKMRTLGVRLEAWGPLSGPTSHKCPRHPGISMGDPRLTSIAMRYNVSTAQIALRWSVHKGVVPVTATCSRSHALADLRIFDFDLLENDVLQLNALADSVKASEVLV